MFKPNFSDIKCIPFGAMTLEQFIVSTYGQEAIRLLKKASDDPLKLIVPFLVAYQVSDLKMQFEDKHPHLLQLPEFRQKINDISIQHLITELEGTLHAIGEESLERLAKILSRDNKINQLKKGKS